MIEGTFATRYKPESDTYEFAVEVSAMSVKLAVADPSRSLAQFAAELIYAEVERTVNAYNA